jgi:isopentenyl diphosphate isomerase/L-lactate dehydrogenase-like FMN-dependent dehydrogenase
MSALPIIFAPTGYTQMMHHTGEPAVANVAVKLNLVYVLSTMGTTSPQELAEKVPNSRRWMQLYIMRNRKNTEKLILAAKNNGFEALMITVDTPVTGIKVRDLKNGLTVPPRIRLSTVLAIASKPKWWINLITTKKLEFAAFRGWDKPLSELAAEIFSPEVTTKDFKWIKEIWKGPIIVKGIQSVEDAKKVAALGVSALVVSNHGGRQLDRSPVPLEILSAIVKAVGNKVEVYLDGGVLSGHDVYAAIALGAKAVMIGRSYLYGIMAGGELGVNRVIEILDRDLRNTMALTGNINLKEVKKSGARIRNN